MFIQTFLVILNVVKDLAKSLREILRVAQNNNIAVFYCNLF